MSGVVLSLNDFKDAKTPGAADGAPPSPQLLPPLRDDLELIEGPRARNGSPTWTIYDPARNRYFRLGADAFHLLSRWSLGEAGTLLAQVRAETAFNAAPADLERLLAFLEHNDLLTDSSPEGAQKLAAKKARAQQHWAMWLLKNYLFLRIPVVRPDRALTALAPLARPFFTRGFAKATMLAAAVGLALAFRQWDAFTHTFLHFLSWQGAVYYGLALFFAKVLHELGHAFAAKLNGCRVPTMGVAFMVLWPVLYTDVTDAWRLSSRRARLRIGAAGMAAELSLAAWATLAWSLLPDGPLRSACFLLATVTWLLTLAVNLNPFMRFDGYYLLSDWLGVQNMQERGFALGRWRMREALFGLGAPKPETLGAKLEGRLILYAYATWVWRFFLFLGIALMVYHYFFKALGVFLMITELAWFLGRPFYNEMRAWWDVRGEMRANRHLLATLFGLAALIALLAFPWRAHVRAPALVEARQSVVLFSPAPARLDAVLAGEGARLRAGAPVYRLSSPHLEQRLHMAELELAALQHEILTRSASRWSAGGAVGVLEEQLAQALADVRGLRAQMARLEIAAPLTGALYDTPRHLAPGRWIGEGETLGRIVDNDGARLHAYLDAAQLARIDVGAPAVFYPDDIARPPIAARVAAIDEVDVKSFERPWLTSRYGGRIAVQPDENDKLTPVEPVYRVELAIAAPLAAPPQVLAGVARIDAQAQSPLSGIWRNAVAVVIRESGF